MSWCIILLSIIIFITIGNALFIWWIILEIISWGVFYFFYSLFQSNSLNDLFFFFIIQSFCSIVWLSASIILNLNYSSNMESLTGINTHTFFIEMIISASIIIKMGIFPGHLWIWNIYNSNYLMPAFLISTLQNLFPVILLFQLLFLISNPSTTIMWNTILIGTLFFGINNLLGVQSNFSFIFLSGIIQYVNILIIGILWNFSAGVLFIIIYWTSTLILILTVHNSYFQIGINPQGGYENNIWFFFIILTLGGFPPSTLFWGNILLINSLELTSPTNILLLIFVVVLFVYILILILSVLRNISLGEINNISVNNSSTSSNSNENVHNTTILLLTLISWILLIIAF